ncbi:hypothetical protein [Psychrobacillus sp. BM2]|uniref:hypothetical protein n=1 Tax=Psychrobacillus sp. BM2 TaxID=3400421 RepID=UPI003B0268D3
MTEVSRFFNSSEYQIRKYNAQDFSNFFEKFISTGLLHSDEEPFLNVVSDESTPLKVKVVEGAAVIKGHLYDNTSELYLDIEPSDSVFDRIDRVVIRYDNRIETLDIKAFVLKGLPSINPVAPVLTREQDVFEISLAQIRVSSNTSVITSSAITDERLDVTVCGLAHSQFTIPYEEFKRSFNQFKDQLNSDFYNWVQQIDEQVEVSDLRKEIELIKRNQIEFNIQQYLQGKFGEGDRGYFFDILKDLTKIDSSNTTATIDHDKLQIGLPVSSLSGRVTWKTHPIGFVSNKVKHFHTRPIGQLLEVTEDALGGQNEIKVKNIEVTITEVN